MAPEQFGHDPVDYRVDIYGLACVAYEALSGRPLVESSDLLGIVGEKLRLVLPAAAEIARGVTGEMHEFLARGLQSRPERRTVDLSRLIPWAGSVADAVKEPIPLKSGFLYTRGPTCDSTPNQ